MTLIYKYGIVEKQTLNSFCKKLNYFTFVAVIQVKLVLYFLYVPLIKKKNIL